MIKRAIFAVCAALVLAVQTALPVKAQQTEASAVADEIFLAAAKDGKSLYESVSYGEADRIVYCYTELYGADGADNYISSAKEEAQKLISSDRFVKPTDLQKCAIALSHYGECSEELINAAVYMNEDFVKQGLNAYIWGLLAAVRSGYDAPDNAVNTQASIAEYLLSRQLADGGFALVGDAADCDITAAAIYALAPLSDEDAVSCAVKAAFSALEAIQLESGGFSSMGVENCESTAQAIIAAAVLGKKDWIEHSGALEALLSYRCEGGFSHLPGGEMNPLATSQACMALTAYCGLTDEGQPSEPQDNSSVDVSNVHEEKQSAAQSTSVTGSRIKIAVVAVCGTAAAALAAVWFFCGRKKRCLLAAAAFAVAGIAAAAADFSTPDEYYAENAVSGGVTVTVAVECGSVFDNRDKAADGISLPESAELIERCEVTLSPGATAFDALAEAARLNKLTLDYINSWSGVYVRGIGGLYEFDFGSESGWMYEVNGQVPDRSLSGYELTEGDSVTLFYTCTLGRADEK
ncbi:MAG: DUF4430 domain-containing protein [Oscillospiraceae bacterium]